MGRTIKKQKSPREGGRGQRANNSRRGGEEGPVLKVPREHERRKHHGVGADNVKKKLLVSTPATAGAWEMEGRARGPCAAGVGVSASFPWKLRASTAEPHQAPAN
jgi:hypothetical protein